MAKTKYFRDNIGFRALLIKAMNSGSQLEPIMHWYVYKKCTNPFTQVWGNTKKGIPRAIHVHAPCRKCDNCLRLRQYIWRRKARIELERHAKAWFITWTFEPMCRLRLRYLSQIDLNRGSSGTDLPDFESLLVKETGKEIQKYFKRLRKNTSEELRYIAVSEFHKDGFPHWHGLIFGNLTKRQVESSWHNGFTSVKLVRDVKTIDYVTKYLNKETESRIRASLYFGRPLDRDRIRS